MAYKMEVIMFFNFLELDKNRWGYLLEGIANQLKRLRINSPISTSQVVLLSSKKLINHCFKLVLFPFLVYYAFEPYISL